MAVGIDTSKDRKVSIWQEMLCGAVYGTLHQLKSAIIWFYAVHKPVSPLVSFTAVDV